MTDDKRIEIIRKLLTKAEAEGTTPEERETLSAKAGELMIKYGIDEAVARASATGTIRTEKIIVKEFKLDVPVAYSHEYAVLGYVIAEALGTRSFIRKYRETRAVVVGFESDVELVGVLYQSLALQCTLSLGTWFRSVSHRIHGGTPRFNAKRGFIAGFSNGVKEKLTASRKQAVADAGHGAELVLVDRGQQLDSYMNQEFRLGRGHGRRYDPSARGAGFGAGQRADIGQGSVSKNIPNRPAIGG